MSFMIALYLLLMASGQGPGAIGMTVQQADNASHNYLVAGQLPVRENIDTRIPPPQRANKRVAQTSMRFR